MAQSTFMTDAFQPEFVSWAALLGRWMDFARASAALPRTPEGDQWRSSVSPMITLQAVTFALSELEQVDAAERMLGWDRGEMLCEEAIEQLDQIWGPAAPPEIIEVVEQAEAALGHVLERFSLVLIQASSEVMIMPAMEIVEPVGSCTLAAVGTPIMPGAPMAWWSDVDLDQIRALQLPGVLQLLQCPVQVWRCRNELEQFSEDVVTDLDTEREDGLPLLVPRVLEGMLLSDPMPDSRDVMAFHERFMQGPCLPVRWMINP
ncbi:MAG: hypothetical protein P8M22_08400 [Phycisphaerales bacterium]|nr:hypothetical protein [Phycisphaerales bacterium]